jgi:hypothetical protein
MKVTTLRLPEQMHESIEEEAADAEMSVAEYIRAVLRTRQEHTPTNTLAQSPGDSPGEYDELRERVAELEARVDELEDQTSELNQQTGDGDGSVLVKTDDIEAAGGPFSADNPYGEHVETALEALRQAGKPLRRAQIMAVVPEADIKDDSLWTEYVRPGIKERGAELRGRKYTLADADK